MINWVCKEVSNCDTCQCTKHSNKNYGKVTAKSDEEIPRNELCVDLIVTNTIRRKEQKVKLKS